MKQIPTITGVQVADALLRAAEFEDDCPVDVHSLKFGCGMILHIKDEKVIRFVEEALRNAQEQTADQTTDLP